MSTTQTLNDQINAIYALYHSTDLANAEQRTALVAKISASGLPAFHKEVLVQVLTTVDHDMTTLGLYVLRQRENMRHAESLLRIESSALAERQKRHRKGS